VLSSKTKITLGEAVKVAAIVLPILIYAHSQFAEIKGSLKNAWTVSMQAEWQSEYRDTGKMPSPFEIQRRAFAGERRVDPSVATTVVTPESIQ
jgi:hypothetical protein